MAEPKYKLVDGEYIELTAEEIKELEDRAAEADLDFSMVRIERNSKLSQSDWTQISDSPLTDEKKAEWATHRQELRDLPTGFTKVSEVVWPTPPE